ncbi:DEAD/DEAH box helicase [Lacipirellula sp.]|uniref:DEAD/DEAH box helicase n=1 Tax=Lacipirellula sp. TaxID=2691419 RepID=UPI003D116E8A
MTAPLRNVAIEVLRFPLDAIEIPATAGIECEPADADAFALPLAPLKVRTFGRVLPEGSDVRRHGGIFGAARPMVSASVATRSPIIGSTVPRLPQPTATRIRPPRDVVKLEDRLAYLLQPPLENLLASEALDFPFKPFPYQLDGIAYLYPRHEAVLADEMGLGKTMQTVVTLRLLAHQGLVRRALLVCPKPLVTNWRREFSQWAPELPVTIVEGSQSQRQWIWNRAEQGVLIANYEVVVRDRELALNVPTPFDLMVVDEAQRIKNRTGATHESVCAIPRSRSWALTGTPIENSADDLVGIFEFVSPGRLRPQMKTAQIRSAVGDHVLRRTKDNVLTQLPPKLIRDADVQLTPEQWSTYQRAEADGVVRLNDIGAELTIQHVFELVLRLKQICNFDPATGSSAKLDRLEADLEECTASGRKAIVFSQWVNSIDKLRGPLSRFGPLEYHGRIPSNRRDGVIEQFRNDPRSNVLLMSYGAGSVGLNLQFASYVFLFDRWWNPAVEDQAINRAHRIGAAGPVTVTRFLASGTIEERIDRVLAEKRDLFNAVFDEEHATRKLRLSRDEIFGLFNLRFPEPKSEAAAA